MVQFSEWCDTARGKIGAQPLLVISGDPARLNAGIAATAAIAPTHYAAEERVVDILRRLGKPAAAQFVKGKLPAID